MEKPSEIADSGNQSGDGIPEAANENVKFAEGMSGPSTETLSEPPASVGGQEGLESGEAAQGLDIALPEAEDTEGGGAEQLPSGDADTDVKTALAEEGRGPEPSNFPALTAESLQGLSLKELRVRIWGLGSRKSLRDFLCMIRVYDTKFWHVDSLW